MLYERELNTINRAIKFAKIADMAFRISYLPNQSFNIEFVQPKKGGQKFEIKGVPYRNLHHEIFQLIAQLEVYLKQKNDGKEILSDD